MRVFKDAGQVYGLPGGLFNEPMRPRISPISSSSVTWR